MKNILKKYEPIIGLEVHAQLKTKTKMFCACKIDSEEKPNINICPICTGQPGTLPTVNRQAIELAIKTGLTLHSKIHNKSVFARKNYFYPDLTKGYQISQHEFPICTGGYIDIKTNDQKNRISITRAHLEEDAGKLLHDFGDNNSSHVDYNRCGTPLIEIVSGPDMRTSKQAGDYLRKLRNILVYLDVCEGNLQEGNFRCDANISLRPIGQEKFGTRAELKNLNSFKSVEKAIEFEIKRQADLLDKGQKIIQETRLWNDIKNKTLSMRGKEEAHDYRYFPDPDLLPLIVEDSWVQKIKKTLPELATEKAKRFVDEYKIPEYDALILTEDKALAVYYETCVSFYNEPKKISNWIMTELLRELKNDDKEISNCLITPKLLTELIKLIDNGTISGKIAKDVFEEIYKTGVSPDKIVEGKGLVQVSDSNVIEQIIDKVITNNPKQIEQYQSGKQALFGFFVGQVMKETKGKANPKLVNEILKKKLG